MLSLFLISYYRYKIKGDIHAENRIKVLYAYWFNGHLTLRLINAIKLQAANNTVSGLINLKKKLCPKWYTTFLCGFIPLLLLCILERITGWDLVVFKVIPPFISLIPVYMYIRRIKDIDKVIDKYQSTACKALKTLSEYD